MTYNEIKAEIMDAPETYLPGLLVAVVKATLDKKVLKPGGAARIAQEVEDEATGKPEDVASGSMQRRVSRPIVVTQDLVNEIVLRAKGSCCGLGDAERKPNILHYSPKNIESLAHCLVSSWTAKYDLVSVFSAAMSVIEEKAANGPDQR
jgi:hypothetical protein